MQQRRTERPGEAEAREEIPDPKKPKTWDGWASVIFIMLNIIGVFVFDAIDFKFNSIICGGLIFVGLGYYTYYLLFVKSKRRKKYEEELGDRRRLRRSVADDFRIRGRRVRPNVSSRPWPGSSPRIRPAWKVRNTWDTESESVRLAKEFIRKYKV